MYNCLIWGSGLIFHKNLVMIKYYEKIGEIRICGVTSRDEFYANIAGYSFIKKKTISTREFVWDIDRIIVMADGKAYKEICGEIVNIGFEDSIIVPYKVMSLLGFDFKKYELLRVNTPSIISLNCWGGFTYNTLGLQFKSPTINMFFNPEDYLKFIRNLKYYMEQPLEFKGTNYNLDIDMNYPIIGCDDITIYFNHYRSFESAVEAWEKRKARINWNNLFVMFFADNEQYMQQFSKCYSNKKVYFSRNIDLEIFPEWMMKVDCLHDESSEPFYAMINKLGKGEVLYYDIFELLLNGSIKLYSEI